MIHNAYENFIRLLFPHLCLACMQRSIDRSQLLCLRCLAEIPYTDHFNAPINKVVEHFYGRIPIRHGAALLYFGKGSLVQNMLHNFKYKGQLVIGRRLGKQMGKMIAQSNLFGQIDLVIPIPIHKQKRLQRGFNQTEIIAQALVRVIEVSYNPNLLVKLFDTETQTNKNRSKRQLNVKDSLGITNKEMVVGKNILLVDDVITTGATAAESGRILLACGAQSISIVAAGAATTSFL